MALQNAPAGVASVILKIDMASSPLFGIAAADPSWFVDDQGRPGP
jgi:hypothetical protein